MCMKCWKNLSKPKEPLPVSVSPMIFVPNQLVGAPTNTNVTLECLTEAHPRSINYWMYQGGMLLPTAKHSMTTNVNGYRARMRLTIHHLAKRDIGNYRCVSKNSLGETEGSIRLYGKFFSHILWCTGITLIVYKSLFSLRWKYPFSGTMYSTMWFWENVCKSVTPALAS